MVLLKDKFLCEEPRDPVKKVSNNLFAVEDKDKREFKEVRVIRTSPFEEKVSTGDLLIVQNNVGEQVDVEGEKLLIVHKRDIIYYTEADEA